MGLPPCGLKEISDSNGRQLCSLDSRLRRRALIITFIWMGLPPCGLMDKVVDEEDVFPPKSSTNFEQFLNDPLLLEAASYTPSSSSSYENEETSTTEYPEKEVSFNNTTTTSNSSSSSSLTTLLHKCIENDLRHKCIEDDLLEKCIEDDLLHKCIEEVSFNNTTTATLNSSSSSLTTFTRSDDILTTVASPSSSSPPLLLSDSPPHPPSLTRVTSSSSSSSSSPPRLRSDSPPPPPSLTTVTSSSSSSSLSSSYSLSSSPFYSSSYSHSHDIRLVDEVLFESSSSPSSQHESHELSVVSSLPSLLQSNNAECLEKVVPHVQEMLSIAEPDIQVAASSAFLQILQKELVPIQSYPQMFLQTILNSIDNKDPDISNAWLGTLLDVIDLLPKDIIKKEILTAAVAKGQLSQSVPARLSCCQILGKIATKFDPFVIKKEILPVVQSLCQDVDYEVRGCMCKQLNPVARGLGLEATKSAILPELVELTNDEEIYVRMMGLETVVNILSLLDDDTCSNTIIPLVIRFYEQCLCSEDHTLPIIAKHIGSLCHGLSVNLDESQKEWFLDCYKKLCLIGLTDVNIDESIASEYMYGTLTPNKHPILDCRINAAYNFPAICMFVGYKDFELKLQETFSLLCVDPLPAVRKNIACGFHEVIKLLGPLSVILLRNLANLLRDNHIEVLRGISPHLPEIFEVLGKHKVSEMQVAGIIPALTAAESVIFSSFSWRLQQEFMLSLATLPKCFNSQTIYDKMMPVIYFKLKKSRAVPVRLAVARTFLTLIRTLKKAEHREQLLNQLTIDFRHGNCYHRALYLELCSISLDIYSKSFFKEHFFDNCLSLYRDAVPNIRLKLCRFIPRMKQTLNSPEDDERLDDLSNVLSKVRSTDLDQDVLMCASQASWELKQIVVPVHLLVSKTQEKLQTAEDLIDLHREAEEETLLNDEKNEEKAKAKKEVQYSKIPSPRKVIAPKTNASTEKSKSTPPPSLKDSKRSLSTSSSVLPQASSPKDSKPIETPCKRDTKIPVMGSSPPISKDTKITDRLSNPNTRIPRVSVPAHPPSPVPASMIPTSPGSQKQVKSGIKPTTPVCSYRRSTGSAPSSPSLSTSSSSSSISSTSSQSSSNTPNSSAITTSSQGSSSSSTKISDRQPGSQVKNLKSNRKAKEC